MLHGVTVRSPAPRGIIRDIDFEPGVPWDEFTVVTAADIPGTNVVALILDDQPYLARETVNHPEEPVVLLAHPDRHLLEEARRRVRIDVEPLPPVFTIDESLGGREVIWGTDNVFKSLPRVSAATSTRRSARRRDVDRGRVRHRRAGAALHRAERHARRRGSARRA